MNWKKLLACGMSVCLLSNLMTGCTQFSSSSESSELSASQEDETDDNTPVLRIATSEISGDFNPLFSTSLGDCTVNSLIFSSPLTIDRNGNILTQSVQGETAEFQDEGFFYYGITNISSSQSDGITTYTLSLREDITFSDGVALTADDLIFTLYVLCDSSYDGPITAPASLIQGVEEYQQNNTASSVTEVSQAEIIEALNSPSDELKSLIVSTIIRPVLEEESSWCEANWTKYTDRGYGDSAEEFFVTLYTSSVDASYSASGKTMSEILEDTITLFGMIYKTLAKNYQGDSNYFDDQVKELVKEYLYQYKMNQDGGTETNSISGIVRIDDLTVQLTCNENDDTVLYDLLDFYILPLHIYGDPDLYDAENGTYGFTRGDISIVRNYTGDPIGSGAYCYSSFDEEGVVLVANSSYFLGEAELDLIKLVSLDEAEWEDALLCGFIDMAVLTLTADREEDIVAANENGFLLTLLTYTEKQENVLEEENTESDSEGSNNKEEDTEVSDTTETEVAESNTEETDSVEIVDNDASAIDASAQESTEIESSETEVDVDEETEKVVLVVNTLKIAEDSLCVINTSYNWIQLLPSLSWALTASQAQENTIAAISAYYAKDVVDENENNEEMSIPVETITIPFS